MQLADVASGVLVRAGRCVACGRNGFYSDPSGRCGKCRPKTKCVGCGKEWMSTSRNRTDHCGHCREKIRNKQARYG